MLLIIDNYDSFTYNLAQYFQRLGVAVEVYRNDQISVDEIRALAPRQLVISPGPCTPNEAGISLAAIRELLGEIPILGVCLGHQALGQVLGAKVVKAPQVMHGKQSLLHTRPQGLFTALPRSFSVTRYHSLLLDAPSLPETLCVDAWCEQHQQTLVMAMHHRTLPAWGVQFHPESILSEYGLELLQAFLEASEQWHQQH